MSPERILKTLSSTNKITDEEWTKFTNWWHTQWSGGIPLRYNVQIFLNWRKAERKEIVIKGKPNK